MNTDAADAQHTDAPQQLAPSQLDVLMPQFNKHLNEETLPKEEALPKPKPLRDWLTTFPLVPIILDPYTEESSRILPTAYRILSSYRDAGCRPCWILTCSHKDAEAYLGPWAEQLLTFTDPKRQLVATLGVGFLPAFLFILPSGAIARTTEGWDPVKWRSVAETISRTIHWSRPLIGSFQDPAAYLGTPAQP